MLVTLVGYAQELTQREEYFNPPTIIPPSPTISNLMNFTNFPANNSTGIPNISIPIFSTKTRDNNLSINLSLNYHPNGVMVKNYAGILGTGWSMFSGGAISRVMKGMPDETSFYGVLNNGYYNYTNQTIEEREQFLYDVAKGCYDGEPDSFSFNFFGHSGKLILYKDIQSINQIYIDSESNLKINTNYNQDGQIDSFVITDDQGYIYYFEDKEITTVNKWANTYLPSENKYVLQYPSPVDLYTSSWNLTRIDAFNNEELLTFEYDDILEVTENYSYSENIIDDSFLANEYYRLNWMSSTFKTKLLPERTTSQTRSTISTNKLKKITITDIGEIDFTNEKGRLDYLTINNGEQTGALLKDLSVKNIHGKEIKKFSFIYSYEGEGNRLFLKELVDEYLTTNDNIETISNNEDLRYHFNYNDPHLLPNTESKNTDYWGFFNNAYNNNSIPVFSDLDYTEGGNRETDERYCTTGLLKEIIYPTGGLTSYDFEANTYSYIRDEDLTEYTNDSNNNIEKKNFNGTLNSNFTETNFSHFVSIDYQQSVTLNLLGIDNNDFYYGEDKNLFRVRLTPVKIENSKVDYIIDDTRDFKLIELDDCTSCLTASKDIVLDEGFYHIELEPIGFTKGITPLEFNLIFSYFSYKSDEDITPYKVGGGVRLKEIKKFESKDDLTPVLHRSFLYNLNEDANKSSGSLVAKFPVHKYEISYSNFNDIISSSGTTRPGETFTIPYHVITDYNNLPSSESSLVEYKNVTIRNHNTKNNQTLNTLQTYNTSIDYPDEGGNAFPFIPINSNSWKRGKLKEVEIHDSMESLVKKSTFNYIFHERSSIEDLVTISTVLNNCAYESRYSKCTGYDETSTNYSCSNVLDYVVNRTYKLNSGVALLSEQTETSFFSNGSNSSKTIYGYNLNIHNYPTNITNYIQGDNSSSVLSLLQNNTSDYTYIENQIFYPQDIITPTDPVKELIDQNRLSLPVKSFRYYGKSTDRSVLKISETYNIYSNWGDDLVLPETIQSSKSDLALEDRVVYHNYDAKGNPVEVSKKDGTKIYYVWGYNQTQPIAKIEGYDAISSTQLSVINQVISASNLDDDTTIGSLGNEGTLRIKLQELREALPEAQVTTFTYDPLIGVTSITDPRGQTIYYQYDGFNRLEFIKDKDGNILKENQYNYKN